ncbi:MAG: alpha-galactosidase, partial [Bacteroidaceae bacterium]|nr:alpha-galactosidase [Bacteroidaceae bacterium]
MKSQIRYLLVLALLLLGGILYAEAQSQTILNKKSVNVERWITSQFAKGKTPPFSFFYGGKPSETFLKTCKHTISRLPSEENQVRYLVSYADKETGLKVECEVTGWKDFGVVEWVLRFENQSQ